MNNYKDEMNNLHAPESLIAKTLERVHAEEAKIQNEAQNEAQNVEELKTETKESSTNKSVKKYYPFIIGAVSLAACFLIFMLASIGMRSSNSKNKEATDSKLDYNVAESVDESYDDVAAESDDYEMVAEDTEAAEPEESVPTDDADSVAGGRNNDDKKTAQPVMTGNATYDKKSMYDKYHGEMGSSFKIFPDTTDGMTKLDYHESVTEGLLDADGFLVLEAYFEKDAFVEENQRLKNVTCDVTYEDQTVTNKVIQDGKQYNYPAYIAMDGFDYAYEYALIDNANQRIIYVAISNSEYCDLTGFEDYLKKDMDSYKLSSDEVLDQFSIYAHKFPEFDGYIVNSD